MISNTSSWSYRIPFALQWAFPLPIFVAVCYAPESPWWLIRANKIAAAKHSLRRLRTQPKTPSDEEFDDSLSAALASMIRTNANEQKTQIGTRY